MNTETEKLYEQLAKLRATGAKQVKEITMLASAYNTMRTMCGILTGIVVIESVALMMLLNNT